MAERICSIEGCEKIVQARGFCPMHYQRWRHHGDPFVVLASGPRQKHRPRPPGSQPCTIEGCERELQARGLCHTHYEKFRRRGELQTGYSKAGAANPVWKGDAVTKGGVHLRLRSAFGPAKNYPCAICGVSAYDWAFDEPTGFSTDLSRYRPLCRKCHMGEDQRARVWREPDGHVSSSAHIDHRGSGSDRARTSPLE